MFNFSFFLYVFLVALVVLLLVGAQQLLSRFGVSMIFYCLVSDHVLYPVELSHIKKQLDKDLTVSADLDLFVLSASESLR